MKDQLSFDIGPDLQALKKYTKMKMNLAAIIRHLHQSLINSKLNDATEQVNELSVKLAEDHFVLATLGQFKRGKSSLMNAILGRNLLPTGILPLTSAITTIKYGPIEKLILSQDNSIFQKELPIEDIVYYVTEKENPSNIKQVKTASIELPLQFLRRGVEFVDTPGVGSAITANTDTTYTFLPQCDAAIFVTSADNPLTSTELDFLHKISRYVEKIFFVVNKIDLLQADEVTQVLAFSKQIISKELNQSDITLFPLSAQIGLNAKTELDTVAYEKSGLKALEEELADFLAKEKGQIFLLKILRQVIKLADENKQMSKELLQFAQMFSDALAIPKRLEEPFEKIVYSTSSPADIYAFSKPSIFQDFHTRGCPACQYIVKATFDFFAHYQYKLSIQKDMQEQLAEYGGVCPFHTWQLNGISSAYGFSLGYVRVVENIAAILRQTALHADASKLSDLQIDDTHCFICQMLKKIEKSYIQEVYQALQSPDGQRLYNKPHGLCLRHLEQLFKIISDTTLKSFLLEHAAKKLENFAEDMKSFALKHETIHRDLQNDNERKAYDYATIHIVGEKNSWVL